MTATSKDCDISDDAGAETSQCNNRTPGAVVGRLQTLEQMDYITLRAEWRRLYRAQPPKRVGRDLLMLGVAWKIQERAYGGLSTATKRRLTELAKTIERDGDVTRNRIARLKPGAKLVREWRGRSHTVIVLDDGFEWDGRRWRSLSAIAREITGVRWSGPRFFAPSGNTELQSDTQAMETSDA